MSRIIHGDCRTILPTLDAESVDCCVTSPPYDDLRTYGGYTWDFESTARELYRVMRDGGVLCWNVGDSMIDGSESLTSAKQKIFFREQCGFRIHQTLIYQKRNFSHPDRSRYHRVFEYVIVLSKGSISTWNPIVDRPNATAGKIGNLGVNTFTEKDGSKSERPKKVTSGIGKRHDVWLGNTRGQEDMCQSLPHPAMMPKWLARDLITSFSNAGDTVLDPFLGSGTTGEAAVELGRGFIGCDVNDDYVKIATRRILNVTPGMNL